MAESDWAPVGDVPPIDEEHLLDRIELLDEVTHDETEERAEVRVEIRVDE